MVHLVQVDVVGAQPRSDASQDRRMFTADRRLSFGHSPLPPYSFVARTILSRRPGRR